LVDLPVQLAGKQLVNPLAMLSGTFGYGTEVAERVAGVDLNSIGAVFLKGITLEPRLGNPTPRMAETACGLLNAIGLENVGVDVLIEEKLPQLVKYRFSVWANVSGSSMDDYAEVCRRLNKVPSEQLDGVELNVSCPNVKQGGLEFGTKPEAAFELVKTVRAELSNLPLAVKLTPHCASIGEMALACVEAGADALSITNTFRGMVIDIDGRKPVLANNYGGVSGAAIKPMALALVSQAYNSMKKAGKLVPIVGQGGVWSGRDAFEFILAGATVVGLGTVCFQDPLCPHRILEELLDYVCGPDGDRDNPPSLEPLVGSLQLNG
jgi:dihydroorotate dehydrogenase (NAD+) catalytic subunit